MKETYQNSEQDRRIGELETQMGVVCGHISTTNEEMGKILIDVSWIKKFLWAIITASVGSIIIGLFNLLIKN